MSRGAVAIDLGATSARFAAGKLVGGRIRYEVIEQIPHRPSEFDGRLEWDVDALLALCRRAWEYAAANFDGATVGIDSWGVDHGFVHEGKLLHSPIAYRDHSHEAMFQRMHAHRHRLYELTGIQHQPFNTIYQLAARDCDLPPLHGHRWMLLPDLLGFLMTGVEHCEFTMASTTQLMGLDDQWSEEAFEVIGWPVPDLPISMPGQVLAKQGSVSLVSVGSHDTASAVFGLGPLRSDQAFLNVGTWSLLGTVSDQPILASEAFTNERAVDGSVRYLTNIPGFYVVNRVHEELGLNEPVSEWLASADSSAQTEVDLTRSEFFNPESMLDALAGSLTTRPESAGGWATAALGSLLHTTVVQLASLEAATGRSFREIRASGGGSRSEAFCRGLARRTGLPIVAGPDEATLLGNLGLQFVASGDCGSIEEASALIGTSFETRRYEP